MSYNYLISTQFEKKNINLVVDIYKTINDLKLLNCPLCYIFHDSDLETTKHFHCIVLCCNVLKVDLIKMFPYSDITIIDSVKGSFEYLTHKNDDSKIKYDEENIIYYYCSKDLVLNVANGLKHHTSKSKENDVIENIINDLFSNKYQRLSDYLKIYGAVAFKHFRTISELYERFNYININEVEYEEERKENYS